MDRERSRRRNSSVGTPFRVPRKDEVDEDAKSTGSMHTIKSRASFRDDGDSTLVTVVELCSDTLVDRFLEFQPLSVVIRAYDGPDQPGAIVGAISTTTSNVVAPERATQVVLPDFQLLFYEDTEFFHVMDRNVTLILCSSSSAGQRYAEVLRALLEGILRVQCVPIPSMSSIVKYGYTVAVNLTAFVCAKKAVTPPQLPQPVWASGHSLSSGMQPPPALLRFPTTAASAPSRETYSKSSAWTLVHEFCLQFHRGASPFELSAMLEHVRSAITLVKLPRSLGTVLESFLGIVQPLLEIMWRSASIPALRDCIAEVVQLVVEMILAQDIQFLFSLKFGDACLEVLVSMMREREVMGWGPATRSAVVTCFALINPMHAVKCFRTKLLLTAADLLVVVDVLALCGANAFRGTGVFQLHGSEIAASERLQAFLVGLKTHFLQFQQSHALLSPPLALREPLSASHVPAFRAKLRVIWRAFPSILEIVEALLNDVMESLSSSAVGETHGKMLMSLKRVSMLVTISMRTLLFLDVSELDSVISQSAPSLSTFFRRVPSWFAFVDAELHSTTLSQAILFAVAVAIIRSRFPNRLPHIQHEWLTRVSLGCGAVGYRSVVMELHFVFEAASSMYPSWTDVHHAHHALVLAVFAELASTCERILRSAPSPSTLLSSWESCMALVRAYLAVIHDPGLLSPRLNLARTLLHAGIREVGVDKGWNDDASAGTMGWSAATRLPALPHASVEWDDLSGFRELRRVWRRGASIAAKQLDNDSLGMFVVVMEYLLPALESDRVARRWNSLSAQLFQVAQFLVEQRAPQALTGTVMEAAVALSTSGTAGMDVASLVTLSQRYCAEAFERLSATMAWRLAVPLRTEQHLLEENDKQSPRPYRTQETGEVTVHSVGIDKDGGENQSQVTILASRKKKRSVNVLHRFAGL